MKCRNVEKLPVSFGCMKKSSFAWWIMDLESKSPAKLNNAPFRLHDFRHNLIGSHQVNPSFFEESNHYITAVQRRMENPFDMALAAICREVYYRSSILSWRYPPKADPYAKLSEGIDRSVKVTSQDMHIWISLLCSNDPFIRDRAVEHVSFLLAARCLKRCRPRLSLRRRIMNCSLRKQNEAAIR